MYPQSLISTLSILLVLALLISSCGGKPGIAAELTYEMRGKIADESGVPVPSARITFYEMWVNANVTDNNGGFEEKVRILGEAMSDESGGFELTFSAHPGLKQVSIKKDGFLDKNTTCILNSEKTTPITGPYTLEYADENSSHRDHGEMLIKHE